jgi:hypothetical protein
MVRINTFIGSRQTNNLHSKDTRKLRADEIGETLAAVHFIITYLPACCTKIQKLKQIVLLPVALS